MTHNAISRADSRAGDAPDHIGAIDGLRAVAVLAVMLFHLDGAWLPGGFVGVDIFFVISGFVVTESLRGRQFARIGDLLKFFYARRLLRIMPALVVMTVSVLLLSAMFIPDAWLSDSIYRVGLLGMVGASNVALAMATDSYFAPKVAFNPFLHTWSLGVEEQFYLLFPLIIWLQVGRGAGTRSNIALVAALSAASLVVAAVLTSAAPGHAFYSVFARFWELGAGMLLNLTMGRWRPVLAGAGERTIAMAAGAAVVALLATFAIPEGPLFPFPLAILPTAATCATIMIVTSRLSGLLARGLSARAPAAIGKLSYSLYLWHWPVFVLLRWTTGLDTARMQAIAVAIVFALGFASYQFVEQPFRRLSKRVSTRMPGKVAMGSIGAVLAISVASAVFVKNRSVFSLSVTSGNSPFRVDENRPLFAAAARCRLERTETPLADGSWTTWTPADCPLGSAPRRRVYVAGDSHSLALRPVVLQYAAEQGVEVHSAFRSGCYFLSLFEPLSARPYCRQFTAAVLDRLRRDSRPGDVIFLPSLRIPRLQDQGLQVAQSTTTPHDRMEALAEAKAITALLAESGARIVIEAPLPVFWTAPVRCSDWFNRDNVECRRGFTIPAAFVEEQRRPVLAAANVLARQYRFVSVWDPFKIVCSGAVCNAFQAGKPLFFDGDHLSQYGNEVLYPSFKAELSGLDNPG